MGGGEGGWERRGGWLRRVSGREAREGIGSVYEAKSKGVVILKSF